MNDEWLINFSLRQPYDLAIIKRLYASLPNELKDKGTLIDFINHCEAYVVDLTDIIDTVKELNTGRIYYNQENYITTVKVLTMSIPEQEQYSIGKHKARKIKNDIFCYQFKRMN